MKQMKNIGITMMAALALAATSCSDFDDYNEVGTSTLPTADATLWENISQQENLSDFKALLVKTGYDKLLNAPSYYTVWAPLNGSYDAAKWMNADSATARKQFVENHLCQYSYGASGEINNRVLTANEKKYTFTSQGGLTFAGIEVEKANIPGSNGMLHLLKSPVPFYTNFYEYLQQNKETDSLSKYIAKYETRILDEANSVKGPMKNGVQTYLDSVMIIENAMLGRYGLNAKLDNEDSTYTMLLPTNEAWDKSYAHIKSYFNFNVKQIVGEDLGNSASTTNPSGIIKTTTAIADHVYLTDSLTRQYLIKHLVYSNNSTYNKCLEKTSFAATDSLLSTYGGLFSHPGDILAHKVAEVNMSNGQGWVVDSIALRAEEWYNPVWASRAVARDQGAKSSRVSATSINPKYGSYPNGIDFAMIKSNNEKGVNSWMEFNLPPLLSTKYRFYVVVVPADADMNCDSYAPEDVDSVEVDGVKVSTAKPAYFYATLSYCNAKGEIAYHYFTSGAGNTSVSADDATALAGKEIAFKATGAENITTAQKTTFGFISDSTKIDTICLGDFTFPVSYVNMINVPQRENQVTYVNASNYAVPNLKLRIPYMPTNAAAMKKYTPNWRIANILMVPVELIEQRNEN